MAWLARGDFTGSDYVQASDLNNLHNDDVTWGGNVNGGGYTLSNVILEGVATQSGASGVSSFNTRIGAVVSQSGDYTAAMVGAVPTSLQILTPPGSGLSGGGPLTGNLSLSAAMVSFNARIGAITLTPADISGAMGVLQSRAITAGAGLQGGGNLAQDVPLSVIPGDPTQQIQFIQGGLAVATRHAINFISGANVNVAVADPGSASGRVDVTISSTGGGSGMVDPTTTKGDVIVRGPSITGRLPVGADGQVLTADSTQSLGVKWGAASGSGAVASVFGRTGAVVAATGDYSAAQVTNAVDRSQTYSDPMWLTGLNWSKIIAAPTFLLDPTTTKGDLVVRGASAISRLPVGGDGAILVADSTQALGVRWGASLPSSIPAGQFAGDMLIWQQAGGWGLISAAGQPAAVGNVLTVQSIGASTKLTWQAPPPSQATLYWVNGTQVQSSFGVNFVAGNNTTIAGAMDGSGTKVNITITAGGPTSGLADPTTTKGDLIARATAQVTRLPVGTDGTILMADSTQPLGMKWATVSGGGGGGAQTPWTSNIDAAGFTLNNIPVIQAPASNNNLILNAPGVGGSISLQADGTTMATINETAGLIAWGSIIANVNVVNGGPPSVTLAGFGEAQWSLTGTSSPTTPGTDLLTFQCFQQTAAVYVMNDLGYFGIGVAAPAHAVDAAGDCNVTGLYRIGGAQLAAAQVANAVSTLGSYADPAWITSLAWSKITGAPGAAFYQTPWVTDIDGANHNLFNVKSIGIGTATPQGVMEIKGPAGAYTYLYITGPTGFGGVLEFGNSSAYGELYTNGLGDILLGHNGLADTFQSVRAGAIPNTLVLKGGNVGIGTTTPTATLHVRKASAGFAPLAGTQLFVENSGGPAYVEAAAAAVSDSCGYLFSSGGSLTSYIIDLSNTFQIVTSGSRPIAFNVGANERMRITPAGAVGIGTATPNATLETSRAVSTGYGLRLTVAGLNAAGQFNAMDFYDSTNASEMGAIQAVAEASYGCSLVFASKTPTGSAGSATEKMRITGSGNVGIGTASPAYTLDCQGTMGFVNVLYGNGKPILGTSDPYLRINQASESASGIWIGSSNLAMNTGYFGVGSQGGQGGCVTISAAAGDAINRITIDGNSGAASFFNTGGNFGIGLAAPRSALSICAPTNPSTPATATQLTICDGGNSAGYQLGIGFYVNNGTTWTGAIQALAGGGGTNLVLQPLGGAVGIGVVTPRSALTVISGNPSGFGQNLLTLGEASNNTAYQLGLTFTQANSRWVGSIQALEGGVGGALFLNPLGGGVRVGGGAMPSYNLDITGDCNVSGVYRVNGAPFASGIAGITFAANNAAPAGTGTGLNIIGSGGTAVFLSFNAPTAAYTVSTASDVRLKQNVTPLLGGLSIIERLRPIRAEWNGLGGKTAGEPIISVLAQDLQTVEPDAVYAVRAKLQPEDAEAVDILGIEPLALIAHLILAVQQLEKRLKALEPEVVN